MPASEFQLAKPSHPSIEQRLAMKLRAEDLTSEQLKRVHADWSRLKTGDKVPDYRSFDICDFSYIVGSLNMMSVERNPWRFRYRVHSTLAVRNCGKDLTGLYLDDYPSEVHRRNIETFCIHAAQNNEPTIDIAENIRIFRRMMLYETVGLPFGNASGEITHLALAINSRPVISA